MQIFGIPDVQKVSSCLKDKIKKFAFCFPSK